MPELFSALSTPPPDIPAARAAEILDDRYSLEGVLEPLSSERDQNYLVQSSDGERYVLKFSNVAEAAGITDMQNRALLHIAARDPDFPAPRVIPTLDDSLMFEEKTSTGDVHRVRLFSWLDGVPVDHSVGVPDVAAEAGTCLATLGRLLEDFQHPHADYGLPWDIRNAAALAELLPHVGDPGLRQLCRQRIERFRDRVEPRLAGMRCQVIHNDMNPSNLLVDRTANRRIAGIIDFGDMVWSQLINDVAVAAAYLCRSDDDPFTDVTDFLAAYASITPLTADEIELLPDLIAARHLTTVMISHWRSAMYPDNRDYILRSEKRARRMLETIAEHPMAETVDRFRAACGRG